MFPKKKYNLRPVYLDYAAATPVDHRVQQAMKPYFSDCFANPSTVYTSGVQARVAVDTARRYIANFLGTQPDTIVFTSGGTESCNLAIFGALLQHTPQHIITTKVEHSAVLEPIRYLEQQGWEVTYLDVDATGAIRLQDLKDALRPETMLVSVMYVNNELGNIYPIQEIGKIILKWRKEHESVFPYFHTDACQASLYCDLSVERLHCDFLSINAGKLYGPKGIGALYIRRGISMHPLLQGGGQEHGLRSGTENVSAIVGFGKAISLIDTYAMENIVILRDYFWDMLSGRIPDIYINGPSLDNRIPNNLHVWFKGVEAETLALYLSEYGIMVGVGSACMTGKDEDSHVLRACGFPTERNKESIRFTLGKDTTKKDIEHVLRVLPNIVSEIRKMNSTTL